ncbi:MAG: response regulator transcription factor [Acidimicrobiales bacterium]
MKVHATWSLEGPTLIVDDHRTFAQAVRVVFENNGIAPVVIAETLEEGRRLGTGKLALVVTDLELPDGYGGDLVGAFVAAGVPVVVVSAHASPGLVLQWAEAGVHDFVNKSVDLDDLVTKCQAARRGVKTINFLSEDHIRLGSDPQQSDRPLWSLTSRERDVLRLFAQGAGTREIADDLCLSVETVRTYVKRLLEKLGVHSRLEAVAAVRKFQLLEERWLPSRPRDTGKDSQIPKPR